METNRETFNPLLFLQLESHIRHVSFPCVARGHFWVLGAGCWVPGAGCWVLGADC